MYSISMKSLYYGFGLTGGGQAWLNWQANASFFHGRRDMSWLPGPTSLHHYRSSSTIMKAKSVYNNSRSCGIQDNASFAQTNGPDSHKKTRLSSLSPKGYQGLLNKALFRIIFFQSTTESWKSILICINFNTNN